MPDISRLDKFYLKFDKRARIYRAKSSSINNAKDWKRTSQYIHQTLQIWWDLGLYMWNDWIKLSILSYFESMSSVNK